MINWNDNIFTFTCVCVFVCCSESEISNSVPEHLTSMENLAVLSLDQVRPHNVILIQEQTFGDTEDVFMGRVKEIAVDEQERVFIAESGEGRADAIYAFNPDGSFITKVGREGDGPGEFRHIRGMQVLKDRLYIYDGRQWIHIFELDLLTFSHSIALNQDNIRNIKGLNGTFPGRGFFVRNDDTFLVNYRQAIPTDGSEEDRYLLYYLRDSDGKFLPNSTFRQKEIDFFDPKREPAPGVPLPFTMPYTRSPLIEVSDDGHMYSVWTEDFLIKVFDPYGEYVRALYFPYEKSKLSYRDAIDMTESVEFRRVLRNAELPDTWPAVHSVLLDDYDRLWVSTITDDEHNYHWWILDEVGNLIGSFIWPGERRKRSVLSIEPQKVKKDAFYTREIDDKTGVHVVVRYRIEIE